MLDELAPDVHFLKTTVAKIPPSLKHLYFEIEEGSDVRKFMVAADIAAYRECLVRGLTKSVRRQMEEVEVDKRGEYICMWCDAVLKAEFKLGRWT